MTSRLVTACGALAVLAGAFLLAAQPRWAEPPALPAPAATTGQTNPCALAPAEVKQPLAGLVTIGRLPEAADVPLVGGFSLNVAWRDLQPDANGPLVRPNEIDAAVAAIQAARGPSCALGLKLRVRAGTSAPDWVKRMGGRPVELTLELDDRAGSVPRFWTGEVGGAYVRLQELLAATYDDVPEVREVVMSRCMTFYAEPLLRQPADGLNAAHLREAGLTERSDRVCLAEQTRAHTVWERTPSSLALNPYDALDGSGPPAMALPVEAAHGCRAVLGPRCVLANNSIRWPVLGGTYPQLYDLLDRLGGPVEFQSAAPKRVGDVVRTVAWAIEQRAGSVELEPAVLAAERERLAPIVRDGWPPATTSPTPAHPAPPTGLAHPAPGGRQLAGVGR